MTAIQHRKLRSARGKMTTWSTPEMAASIMARPCTRLPGRFTSTTFCCVEAMRYDDSRMSEAINIGIRALEVLFFGGLIGSAVLVIITAVEDIETVFGGNEAESATEREMQY